MYFAMIWNYLQTCENEKEKKLFDFFFYLFIVVVLFIFIEKLFSVLKSGFYSGVCICEFYLFMCVDIFIYS